MNYNEAKEIKNAIESPKSHFRTFCDFFTGSESKMSEPYVYLFVRQDLSLAQQNVQSIHVGIKAGETFGNDISKANLVYIGVPSKDSLYEVMDIMGRNNINFVEFWEPDYNEGLTAVCSEALTERRKRALFSKYDLWQPASSLPTSPEIIV